MWWWLKKDEETDDAAIYDYGVATQDATGRILINKATEEVTRIKLADGDNEKLYNVLAGYMRSIIVEEGYPAVRSIATG